MAAKAPAAVAGWWSCPHQSLDGPLSDSARSPLSKAKARSVAATFVPSFAPQWMSGSLPLELQLPMFPQQPTDALLQWQSSRNHVLASPGLEASSPQLWRTTELLSSHFDHWASPSWFVASQNQQGHSLIDLEPLTNLIPEISHVEWLNGHKCEMSIS